MWNSSGGQVWNELILPWNITLIPLAQMTRVSFKYAFPCFLKWRSQTEEWREPGAMWVGSLCLGHPQQGDLVSREPAAPVESAVPREPFGDEGRRREGNSVILVIGSWPRISKLNFHFQTCPISALQVIQVQDGEVVSTKADGKMRWRYCQRLDISASVFKQNFISLKRSQGYYPKDSAIIISRCFSSILTFFNALQLFSISQIKHCFYLYPENKTSNLDHSSAF